MREARERVEFTRNKENARRVATGLTKLPEETIKDYQLGSKRHV